LRLDTAALAVTHSEPKGQALFETTAELCTGLIKAFGDYDMKAPAWR
jgi:hypothetical protein